jgi:hypothetical protein
LIDFSALNPFISIARLLTPELYLFSSVSFPFFSLSFLFFSYYLICCSVVQPHPHAASTRGVSSSTSGRRPPIPPPHASTRPRVSSSTSATSHLGHARATGCRRRRGLLGWRLVGGAAKHLQELPQESNQTAAIYRYTSPPWPSKPTNHFLALQNMYS